MLVKKNSIQEKHFLHHCKICKEIFTNQKDLVQHINNHKRKENSPDKTFNHMNGLLSATLKANSSSLNDVFESHKTNNVKRLENGAGKDLSNQQLNSASGYVTNHAITAMDSLTYKCAICDKICPSKKSLYKHKKKHKNKLNKTFNTGLKQCDYVNPEVMKAISNFISDIRKTTESPNVGKVESLNIIKCDKVSDSSELDIDAKSKSHEQLSNLEQTNDMALSLNVPQTNISSENCNDLAIKEQFYKCNLCDRTFTIKRTYLNHKRNHRKSGKQKKNLLL